MREEHIVLVDDNKALCNAISEQVDRKYGEKYSVDRFYDAQDAFDYIREDIDEIGDKLVMVGTDERLNGMQGHEFLEKLTRTHPKCKKFIFSAWSDVEALVSGINTHINGFVSKAEDGSASDPLFELVDRLIEEYEIEPKLEYEFRDIIVKQADTLHEKHEFFRKRFQIYLDAGHKTAESLTPEELDQKMEWDEYDAGGIESMVLSPKTRYVLAMNKGRCAGGARIIYGKCPLETGTCIADGFGFRTGDDFNLNNLRANGVYAREISRLVVDLNSRKGSAIVLLSLFKMIEQLTNERNTLFCTSKEPQVGLYQAIGFKTIGPLIKYSLDGEWLPMMRDRWKAIHDPNSIPGMSEKFHLKAIEPIPANDLDKWNEYSRTINKEAIEKGLYLDEH